MAESGTLDRPATSGVTSYSAYFRMCALYLDFHHEALGLSRNQPCRCSSHQKLSTLKEALIIRK